MTQHYQTPILPFPAPPGGIPPAVEPPRQFVETEMAVGGVALVYKDADGVPRLRLEFDLSVPEPERAWLRKILKVVGDKLPPTSPSRRPLLGPRLMNG